MRVHGTWRTGEIVRADGWEGTDVASWVGRARMLSLFGVARVQPATIFRPVPGPLNSTT